MARRTTRNRPVSTTQRRGNAGPATTGKPRSVPPRKAAANPGFKARRKRWSSNTIVTVALAVVAVIAVAVIVVLNRGDDAAPVTGAADPRLVRADSHKLATAADGKVTLVEFLDFECESCAAAYPSVERIRGEYADRITYVVRYYPLPSHFNAQNSALAVEAAARQGKFEAMYKKMFDTQKTWGEARTSHAETFAGYARDLGLDMTKYAADVADPTTLERVRRDKADGDELGVSGTPTFFLNGEKLEQAGGYQSLKTAIDKALAE